MTETIRITMCNSDVEVWEKEQWDDYKYDGKYFIVIKNNRWVGFYNLDCVIAISVE